VEIYEIFKNTFNSTVADYVKKCRLKKAAELLKETSYSVNLIADKIGVPDYNYFSKIFKVAYGISPREFRKKERER
jgi:YesN/AraC family two-component response regulator